MKNELPNITLINLMDCVHGTTTSSDAMALFIEMDQAIAKNNKIRISLENCTPMSSSFLNASFGEIYERYGYNKLKDNVVIINYKPSQAEQIKAYLQTLDMLAKKHC